VEYVARRKVLVAGVVADGPDRMEVLMRAGVLTMLRLQEAEMEVAAVARRTLSSSPGNELHYRTVHLACSVVAEARNQLGL